MKTSTKACCSLAFLLQTLGAVEPLRAIVLVKDEQSLVSSKEATDIEGLQARGVEVPGSLKELQKRLEPFYSKTTFDSTDIQKIKNIIYQYYRDQDRPFIIITVPSHTPDTDVLQLVITESRLGQIDVMGNQWTPQKRYLHYLTLKEGDPISPRTLSKDIDFMNRNPHRNVNLIYIPGKKEGTTDLTLAVQDRRPYRFYVGFDNTGVPTTGRERVFAGFSWDQMFGLDHMFLYQYTTNYNTNRFHASTLQYTAFLPWQAVLSLYGGFSIVHAHLPAPERNNKGTNSQASLRYTIPFMPGNFFSHSITVGGDFKRTNNTMAFVDFDPVFGQTVNLTQLMLDYQWKYEKSRRVLEGGIECFASPGPWLPDQTNTDFSSLRPGAKNQWIYAAAYLHFRQPIFTSFAWDIYLKGQLSSAPLLPSEQLGLGGYGSVRGYDERQYNADDGMQGSLELHFPRILKNKKQSRYAYFLLFLDGGLGFDQNTIPHIPKFDYLIGTGPGFRYVISPYLKARVDWGIKLHHQKEFTGGSSMVQFSLVGSY
jgi:hemolysin activation/secretion protein